MEYLHTSYFHTYVTYILFNNTKDKKVSTFGNVAEKSKDNKNIVDIIGN